MRNQKPITPSARSRQQPSKTPKSEKIMLTSVAVSFNYCGFFTAISFRSCASYTPTAIFCRFLFRFGRAVRTGEGSSVSKALDGAWDEPFTADAFSFCVMLLRFCEQRG